MLSTFSTGKPVEKSEIVIIFRKNSHNTDSLEEFRITKGSCFMRGVNKLVMEVKSDGKYFDKALLFLKPEHANTAQKEISDGAERLLRRIGEHGAKRGAKKTAAPSLLFSALLGSLAGAAVMFGSLFLCGVLSF